MENVLQAASLKRFVFVTFSVGFDFQIMKLLSEIEWMQRIIYYLYLCIFIRFLFRKHYMHYLYHCIFYYFWGFLIKKLVILPFREGRNRNIVFLLIIFNFTFAIEKLIHSEKSICVSSQTGRIVIALKKFLLLSIQPKFRLFEKWKEDF